MNADPADFSARLREKASDRQTAAMPMIRAAAAVAPIMDRLMTTPDWDRYLQYLQARVDAATKARDTARARLGGSEVWDATEMHKLKSAIREFDGMIMAWEFAMGLPKALQEGAEAALALVAEFEKQNESAQQSQP